MEETKEDVRFPKNTIDDVRVIGAESLQDLYTWIDAAYAVHNDMRSQTGGCISFGYGILHGKSSKQKLNVIYKYTCTNIRMGLCDYMLYIM